MRKDFSFKIGLYNSWIRVITWIRVIMA